jgi:putative Mg2+ transporter-C (MgtC) family protein
VFGNLRNVLGEPWAEVVLVVVAFVCGAIIGVERERQDKPAGLRTLVLICVGSAVFSMLSRSPVFGAKDPGRVAAQVVAGVGFLGAGSIIRDNFGITGVTTAAAVWATAAVGMVVGAGYPTGGLVLSVMILATLVGLKAMVERLGGRCRLRPVVLRYRPENGKTHVRIQQAVDHARGPVELRPERSVSGELAESTLVYCEYHREHRTVLAVVVEIDEIHSVADAQKSGS